jgi:hypothetical protein
MLAASCKETKDLCNEEAKLLTTLEFTLTYDDDDDDDDEQLFGGTQESDADDDTKHQKHVAADDDSNYKQFGAADDQFDAGDLRFVGQAIGLY